MPVPTRVGTNSSTTALLECLGRCVDRREIWCERGDPTRTTALPDWPELWSFVRAHPLDFERPSRPDEARGRFSLARSGRPVPIGSITAPAVARTKTSDPSLDPDLVQREIETGATLLVNDVDSLAPAVADLVHAVTHRAGAPVSARLFATHGSEAGFPPHADLHDTVVVQVSGSKHWLVRAPERRDPVDDDVAFSPEPAGPPAWDGVLGAGDVMIVPRGWWHRVTGTGGRSIHLTFDIHRRTGMQLAHQVAAALCDRSAISGPIRAAVTRSGSSHGDSMIEAARQEWTAQTGSPAARPRSTNRIESTRLLPGLGVVEPASRAPACAAELFDPVPVEEFVAARHQDRPLHAPGDPHTAAALLSPGDLAAVIATRRPGWFRTGPGAEIFRHGVHLNSGGAPLDPREVFVSAERPDGRVGPELDPDRVRAVLADGATLLVNDLQDSVPAVGQLAHSLEETTGDPVRVMAYASWQPVQAFPVHADADHVVVVQVAGEKHWEVFGHERHDTRPRWSGTVRAGEVLFVPRGYYHRVRGTDRPSLHLRFGLFARTGLDVAEAIARVMARDHSVRSPLRFAAGARPRIDASRALRSSAVDAWESGREVDP